MDLAVEPTYPSWHGPIGDGSLEQGDILDDFPLVSLLEVAEEKLVPGGPDPPLQVVRRGVIVLSQSCDLRPQKIVNVIVCPFFTPAALSTNDQDLTNRKGREKLMKGYIVGFYLLPPCDLLGADAEDRVVNFRHATTIPYDLVRSVAEQRRKRIRLMPPYREHMAQAFSRFVGRVGLPVDYPE